MVGPQPPPDSTRKVRPATGARRQPAPRRRPWGRLAVVAVVLVLAAALVPRAFAEDDTALLSTPDMDAPSVEIQAPPGDAGGGGTPGQTHEQQAVVSETSPAAQEQQVVVQSEMSAAGDGADQANLQAGGCAGPCSMQSSGSEVLTGGAMASRDIPWRSWRRLQEIRNGTGAHGGNGTTAQQTVTGAHGTNGATAQQNGTAVAEAPVEQPVKAPVEQPVKAPVTPEVKQTAKQPVGQPVGQPAEDPSLDNVLDPSVLEKIRTAANMTRPTNLRPQREAWDMIERSYDRVTPGGRAEAELDGLLEKVDRNLDKIDKNREKAGGYRGDLLRMSGVTELEQATAPGKVLDPQQLGTLPSRRTTQLPTNPAPYTAEGSNSVLTPTTVVGLGAAGVAAYIAYKALRTGGAFALCNVPCAAASLALP
jgi:hypothetical protein